MQDKRNLQPALVECCGPFCNEMPSTYMYRLYMKDLNSSGERVDNLHLSFQPDANMRYCHLSILV